MSAVKGGGTSRRGFLKTATSAMATTALAAGLAPRSYAAPDETIKVAIVGCGGRGNGALLQALSTQGPTKLWAVADVFPDRIQRCLASVSQKKPKQVDVPKERQFLGLDAYRKAIDSLGKGGVVLLTTPAGFRPIHLEYAVEKGVHVFMEKSFAVDGPGVRRVLKAGELATKKNLKVAGGLMWRHDAGREALIKRVHDGEIGDLILLRTYRMHGPVGFNPKKAGESDLAHQLRNYSAYTWLNASFFVDWLIHDIDVSCWAKGAWPVSAQGQGGRQARTTPDQMFDHFAIEYTFPDGTKMSAQGRHMSGCWGCFGEYFHGTRGSGTIQYRGDLRLYNSHNQTKEHETWRHSGPRPNCYQVEHDLLFDAIRNDKPCNETERCAHACLASILGRMAAFSGKLVTWDQALASTVELAPGLDSLTWDGPAPVQPDKDGRYPVAQPGVTKAF
ncbi:MAG: Gfo/Idh/MocA family oxidoreductase [Candidatus Brocadiae bacterium]|nr:Gfo/Idh/MocA family oxidoreductase [Candidatus Brocadiia bacterium]